MPPNYKGCIAKQKGTKKRRKARCQNEFFRVRREVMGFLLPATWIQAEAAERSIVVTDAEVEQEFAKQRDATFKTDAAYLDYKDDTLLTEADMRFKVRVAMLSDRVRDQALEESRATSGQQEALDRFVAEYRKKWIGRTTCAKRYRARECGAVG